ncbi:MAG: hypothetical protein KIS77_09760 [Saprospiraceae bacterium]|nr:hypothetical protein [Saprospiraceae bacterium]
MEQMLKRANTSSLAGRQEMMAMMQKSAFDFHNGAKVHADFFIFQNENGENSGKWKNQIKNPCFAAAYR